MLPTEITRADMWYVWHINILYIMTTAIILRWLLIINTTDEWMEHVNEYDICISTCTSTLDETLTTWISVHDWDSGINKTIETSLLMSTQTDLMSLKLFETGPIDQISQSDGVGVEMNEDIAEVGIGSISTIYRKKQWVALRSLCCIVFHIITKIDAGLNTFHGNQ